MTRILIVDDEALARAAMRMVLQSAGFDIVEACDGNDVISIVRTQVIDLIICDMFMPGKDGLETIRELRRKAPKIPVIAVSGGGTQGFGPDVLSMAKHFGAAHVLEKPLHRSKLIETVRELVPAKAGTQ